MDLQKFFGVMNDGAICNAFFCLRSIWKLRNFEKLFIRW